MDNRQELKAILKPVQVGALALGCIIGFGCFVLPGDFLAAAGPVGASIGVVLGGLAMLVIARSYGLMVRIFPVAGAEFAYAYHVAGRYHAYVCGWFLTLGYLSIIPLNATALGVLAKFLAPGLFAQGYLYTIAGFDVFVGEVGLAAVAIIVVGIFHYRGVSQVGGLQVVLTALLVGSVMVIAFGTPFTSVASSTNWQPFFVSDKSPIAAVMAIVAITPWLYVGFDTVPQAAEEFNFSPKRSFKLIVWSILVAGIMYVIVILATASVMPWEQLIMSRPLWATGTTVRESLGPVGLTLLVVSVAAAIATGINGFYMATSRLMFSMGRAKLLPAWFSRVHPVYGTPTNAIIFIAFMSLLAPWFGREALSWVVDMSAVGTAFGYVYTCIAAYAVAKTGIIQVTRWDRVSAVAGAVIALGFVSLLCIPGMPAFMALPSWVALSVWITLGLIFYMVRVRTYRSISAKTLDQLILGRSFR